MNFSPKYTISDQLLKNINKDVKKLMSTLLSYLKENKGNIDPLILARIFHKQFILIHPFMDGNGRTCRLVTLERYYKIKN